MDEVLSAYFTFFTLMTFLLMSNVILSRMRDLMVKKACDDLREAHERLVQLATSLKVDASFRLPYCHQGVGGERGGAR